MRIDRFKELEKQTCILEKLATTLPRKSQEYIAVRNAAFALIFAMTEQYDSFIKFVTDTNNELTVAQKENLKKMGIPVK